MAFAVRGLGSGGYCVHSRAVSARLFHLGLIVLRELGLDIEDDPIERAGEEEKLAVVVLKVNDAAVVAPDVPSPVAEAANSIRTVPW